MPNGRRLVVVGMLLIVCSAAVILATAFIVVLGIAVEHSRLNVVQEMQNVAAKERAEVRARVEESDRDLTDMAADIKWIRNKLESSP